MTVQAWKANLSVIVISPMAFSQAKFSTTKRQGQIYLYTFKVASKLCQSCVKVALKVRQSHVKVTSKFSQSHVQVTSKWCESCIKVLSNLYQSIVKVASKLKTYSPLQLGGNSNT